MPKHRSKSRDRERDRRRHRNIDNSRDCDSYYSPSRRTIKQKKKTEKKSKKEKKSKRNRRSRSISSKSSTNSSNSSRSTSYTLPDSKKNTIDLSLITQKNFNLNVLDDQINTKTLDMLNDDTFEQKTFTSTSNKSSNSKVIIDLQKDMILIPTSENVSEPVNDSIFHPNFLGDETIKMSNWIKKLYAYRKKFYNE